MANYELGKIEKITLDNDEGIFYAGDVFNRDSTVCAYNCADSGTLTATSCSINDGALSTITGNIGSFTITPDALQCKGVTGNKGDIGWVTINAVDELSTGFDAITERLQQLESSIAAMSKSAKSVKSIDRSRFKTLSPSYEVL